MPRKVNTVSAHETELFVHNNIRYLHKTKKRLIDDWFFMTVEIKIYYDTKGVFTAQKKNAERNRVINKIIVL